MNGDREARLPNVSNLSFAGVEAESLLMGMPDVAISSGASCTSATQEPSHVLRAMGLPDARIHESVRISLGRPTTPAVARATERIVAAASRASAASANRKRGPRPPHGSPGGATRHRGGGGGGGGRTPRQPPGAPACGEDRSGRACPSLGA